MWTRRSIGMWMALIAGVALLTGCHDRHAKVRERREVIIERHVAPAPAPVVIAEPPPPAREVIIVREAPPPVIVETCPPPPAVGMVWVQGYWGRTHGRYSWCNGHYVRPVPNHRFEPARWEHSRRGWEFHRERWTPEPAPRGRSDRSFSDGRGGGRDGGGFRGSGDARSYGSDSGRGTSHDRGSSRR